MTEQFYFSQPRTFSLFLSLHFPWLSFSLFYVAWALWKSSSGNASENPTFFLLQAGELVVNFSSWVTWEGSRLGRILRRAPCTTQVLSSWSEREIDFSKPIQSLDCALSKKLWVVISFICLWKNRGAVQRKYSIPFVTATSVLKKANRSINLPRNWKFHSWDAIILPLLFLR